MTPFKKVVSKAMTEYAYDTASQTLAIKFVGKDQPTHFPGVPADVAAAFEAAESKGKAWHSLIKGKYAPMPAGAAEAEKEPA